MDQIVLGGMHCAYDTASFFITPESLVTRVNAPSVAIRFLLIICKAVRVIFIFAILNFGSSVSHN